MCIAIAKQAGIAIQESILKTCFENNPDGAGFAYEDSDGKIKVEKGFFSFPAFYTAFAPHEEKKALIHFRIKTHGTLHKNNTHPFIVNDKVVFIHNGMISGVPNHRTKSDTRIFKRLYLRPAIATLGEDVLKNKLFQKLIESFIGGSKLAFMVEGEPNFIIYNKNLGNTSSDGVWFSNTSWQERKVYVPQKAYSWPEEKEPFTGRIAPPETTWQRKLPSPFQKKEVDYLDGPAKEIFSFGTIVKLRWSYNTQDVLLEKGMTGEIDRVYDDRSADVTFYHTDKPVNIKIYQLEELRDFHQTDFESYCV